MARKHLLSDLVGVRLPDGEPVEGEKAREAPPAPHYAPRGAIGAVSRSIEMLKSQSLVELDPDLIDTPKVTDRLEEAPEHFEEFARQIKEHGQQVPILVRPHPDVDGRYQIAYGRRRLRAVKAAGMLVKAAVKPLSDEELVLAQGQENSARHDLSFIERALYAAELEVNGYSRQIIMAALGVDKTGLSRLISSAVSVPAEFIRAIGPAPKAGRDRWIEFAARLERNGALELVRSELDSGRLTSLSSDDRFVRLFDLIAPKKPKTAKTHVWLANDGSKPARYKQDERSFTLVLDEKVAPDFGEFILSSLPDLYAAFKKTKQ